jgi:hypothetical protein
VTINKAAQMNLSLMRTVGFTMGLLSLSTSYLDRATIPASGSIVRAGQMIAARFDHAAVLLSSGRVLIVGSNATE